ncbi:MAG: bifunctional helix-turn-helix transcriptional regulator/GNAT family N-acetyltransferase [Alphaproteobacteria bacterium]|nr:MarR family transcriptional regulator [Rhizobiaceae bacterium]MBU3963787.1 bifunctional helix-turn-helix transcriptional regulator/GNAT family N-acetyltransferase [Alphaproteobacteria bacterium]MBU4049858.1 bifunctional helix-turn-helix transcriptional regulator/GNAT family N-acetyltransferase [Alphaproteobacteria bacterium]MBU4090376.1 bifunctional helix-turn-helix transcriptional regulator/GNAT family N-acetyltransferase [Alphaproteobacteria bacterium]MBU4155165.1 bifunctional helix-turn-h
MRESTDITTIEAMRAFNRFYTDRIGILDRAYLKADYTLAEARIVYEIGTRGEVLAVELVRDLHLDPAYLSRILKKFRERGLVTVAQDPADGRSQRLCLTDSGRAEFETLAELSRSQLRQMVAPLGEDEQASLVAAMATITRLIEPQERAQAAPILRPHRPGDLGWMIQSQTEFYVRTFGWNRRFEALVSQVAADFLERYDERRDHCWIAERAGTRVGSVIVMDGGENIAKMRMLYVDGSARGLGLGKLLVDQCVHFARNAGYRELTLWTNDILRTARHIYIAAGFQLVAEERHTMLGPELNGQTWTLDL